jgi:hypothetical protein
MKRTIAILGLLMLSCSAQKQGVIDSVSLTSECPKNAKCTVELIKNKGIVLKKDDFGAIITSYPKAQQQCHQIRVLTHRKRRHPGLAVIAKK